MVQLQQNRKQGYVTIWLFIALSLTPTPCLRVLQKKVCYDSFID